MKAFLVIVFLWLISATLTVGISVADIQAHRSSTACESFREDLGFGIGYGIVFGPISLLASFCFSGFAEHGLQYQPLAICSSQTLKDSP